MCKEDWTEFGQDYANVYTKTLLILQYVLPVSVLIFTYTSIGIVIWCHRIPGEAEDGRDLRIARSKRKVIYIPNVNYHQFYFTKQTNIFFL